ncbi:MAG: hypothetical protein ACR5LA_04505 [Wolbachia sp.]
MATVQNIEAKRFHPSAQTLGSIIPFWIPESRAGMTPIIVFTLYLYLSILFCHSVERIQENKL